MQILRSMEQQCLLDLDKYNNKQENIRMTTENRLTYDGTTWMDNITAANINAPSMPGFWDRVKATPEDQSVRNASDLLAVKEPKKPSSFEGIRGDVSIVDGNTNTTTNSAITTADLPNHTHNHIINHTNIGLTQIPSTVANDTVTINGVTFTSAFIQQVFEQEYDVQLICRDILDKLIQYQPQTHTMPYDYDYDIKMSSHQSSIDHMSEQIRQHIDNQVLNHLLSNIHKESEPSSESYSRGTSLTELSGSTDNMDHEDPFA